MEEILLLLREGYFALLNNMVVAGKQIPVYDFQAPGTKEPPYVLIGGITQVSDNTKDSFGSRVFVSLEVYAEAKGDFGGRKPSDLIAAEILKRVIPSPGRSGVQRTGIDVIMAKLAESDDSYAWRPVGRTYQRSLTIEHIVWESNT